MSTITWKVNTLSRTLSTGRVDSVHYAVDARSDDEVYSAGAYGELALEGDVVTAYAALGEDKVAEVNAALEAQLTEQATPTTGTGVPW